MRDNPYWESVRKSRGCVLLLVFCSRPKIHECSWNVLYLIFNPLNPLLTILIQSTVPLVCTKHFYHFEFIFVCKHHQCCWWLLSANIILHKDSCLTSITTRRGSKLIPDVTWCLIPPHIETTPVIHFAIVTMWPCMSQLPSQQSLTMSVHTLQRYSFEFIRFNSHEIFTIVCFSLKIV